MTPAPMPSAAVAGGSSFANRPLAPRLRPSARALRSILGSCSPPSAWSFCGGCAARSIPCPRPSPWLLWESHDFKFLWRSAVDATTPIFSHGSTRFGSEILYKSQENCATVFFTIADPPFPPFIERRRPILVGFAIMVIISGPWLFWESHRRFCGAQFRTHEIAIFLHRSDMFVEILLRISEKTFLFLSVSPSPPVPNRAQARCACCWTRSALPRPAHTHSRTHTRAHAHTHARAHTHAHPRACAALVPDERPHQGPALHRRRHVRVLR